jgi:hypothetical protein
LDNKKQRWQERNSEKMNYVIKHRDARRIWITLRKLLKKDVNTEHLDLDRCLSNFATLFTNNYDGILLKEAQVLGPGYNEKLDNAFTTLEVRNFVLKMKNNEASGYGGLPAEVWKRLINKDEGTQILTQLLNMIRNKRVFPAEWKMALMQPVYKGKGDGKVSGNCRGISLLPVFGKIYSGLLAYRLRDWLM